jgi:hypothetical protein
MVIFKSLSLRLKQTTQCLFHLLLLTLILSEIIPFLQVLDTEWIPIIFSYGPNGHDKIEAWEISAIISESLVHYSIRINLLFKVKSISLDTEVSDEHHWDVSWSSGFILWHQAARLEPFIMAVCPRPSCQNGTKNSLMCTLKQNYKLKMHYGSEQSKCEK